MGSEEKNEWVGSVVGVSRFWVFRVISERSMAAKGVKILDPYTGHKTNLEGPGQDGPCLSRSGLHFREGHQDFHDS